MVNLYDSITLKIILKLNLKGYIPLILKLDHVLVLQAFIVQ